jgi:hypothetical protein
VIRHIHIDNRGGQALVAEQVVTGGANAESREQSYEQGALGPALLGEDPLGNIVPMPGREGEEPMPVARGSARHRGS